MEKVRVTFFRWIVAALLALFSLQGVVAASISDDLLEQHREDGYKCVFHKQKDQNDFSLMHEINELIWKFIEFVFEHPLPFIAAFVVLIVAILLMNGKFRKKQQGVGDVGSVELKKEEQSEASLKELLNKAYGQSRWDEVIRLYYLITLRSLAKFKMLEFDEGKTPGEYVYEAKLKDKSALRKLTNMFIYVRYGDVGASKQDADRASLMHESILSTVKEMRRRGRA